ncbi:MAG: UDP-N-acetylglucosamine--N-acetylmuramyl-(pentapeptide) pyrophosphoryl-undecaprenol N-acetylglucosamine transferase [Planctomycetes bacterium]|nr:UDP-N-acetylglucosamine--N-acetylmuramyl-(pentapeptide) pyrophosphoryl-undecaprenol N-acetylglucosamine transferase [Planctomycetota bacterium]
MSTRAPRVLFAGGGTGGHVCPAVAVARALGREAPGAEVLFLGSGRPVERRILEPTGLPYAVVPSAPGRSPRALLAQARALVGAYGKVRAFRPDVVLGLGGFASVPGALAGRLVGARLCLFEPNAAAGRANRWLAPLAVEAYAQWEATRLGCEVRRLGTPLNDAAACDLSPEEARARLGLPAGGRALLVMGGSQGARALNRWIEQALPVVGEGARGVSFVHLAGGDEEAARLRAAYAAAGVAHAVLPFLTDVGLAYRAADLAVVRGGGATLAELLAVGLPARVVPLRGVADDHQLHNARAFARAGAGVVLAEADLGPAALAEAICALDDEVGLARARQAALLAARPDAATAVARRLVEVAGFRRSAGAEAPARVAA